MQHHSRYVLTTPDAHPLAPIGLVSQDGMTEALKMGPDLMRPPCVRVQEKMRGQYAKRPFDPVICDRRLRMTRLGRRPFCIVSIRAKRSGDPAFRFSRHAHNQGFVATSNGMLFKLRRKDTMCVSCFGHYHHARRVFI